MLCAVKQRSLLLNELFSASTKHYCACTIYLSIYILQTLPTHVCERYVSLCGGWKRHQLY